MTAVAAGASYLWKNRATLRGRMVSPTPPASSDRGTTIYHNHPVAE